MITGDYGSVCSIGGNIIMLLHGTECNIFFYCTKKNDIAWGTAKCNIFLLHALILLYWFWLIQLTRRPYYDFIKHANHMTMTTSGQIMSWPVYLKTQGNVNIKLWDLCEILVVYILLSSFESVHMVLTVNKPDVRRFIAWIEWADWNPCLFGGIKERKPLNLWSSYTWSTLL